MLTKVKEESRTGGKGWGGPCVRTSPLALLAKPPFSVAGDNRHGYHRHYYCGKDTKDDRGRPGAPFVKRPYSHQDSGDNREDHAAIEHTTARIVRAVKPLITLLLHTSPYPGKPESVPVRVRPY